MGCVWLSGFGLLLNLIDYFSDQQAPEVTNIVTGEQETLEGAEPLIPIGLAVTLGVIGAALAIVSVLIDRSASASAGTQAAADAARMPSRSQSSTPSASQGTPASAGPARVSTSQTEQPPAPSAPATAPGLGSSQQAEGARARRGEIYAVAGLTITVGVRSSSARSFRSSFLSDYVDARQLLHEGLHPPSGSDQRRAACRRRVG